jgi:hypothetical protein
MTDSLRQATREVFRYSRSGVIRRHGPRGYADYASYKPWRRDEFLFRCVYCLSRERWKPEGQDAFSVDHVRPQSTDPEQASDYDNLTYACCSCNSSRRDLPLPLDVVGVSLAEHLRIAVTGIVEPLTDAGHRLVDLCHLNRPALVEFRREFLQLLDLLARLDDPRATGAASNLLGFPHDLPDLARLRPPGGNSRPDGIYQSCHTRRQEGRLPETY